MVTVGSLLIRRIQALNMGGPGVWFTARWPIVLTDLLSCFLKFYHENLINKVRPLHTTFL
jgi:hypothetical protein